MTDTSANNPFIAPQATVDDLQDGTDSTFKLNLFSADGRIGRVRYLGYSMGLGLLIPDYPLAFLRDHRDGGRIF